MRRREIIFKRVKIPLYVSLTLPTLYQCITDKLLQSIFYQKELRLLVERESVSLFVHPCQQVTSSFFNESCSSWCLHSTL